jgi:large subunit ribosomal protein L16
LDLRKKIKQMFLQPKKVKYKKVRKGTLRKLEFRSNKLKFGTIGLKTIESGTISAKQLEAARQSINRKIKRKGKLWIRIFPFLPITAKPTEVRMGKGKGAVSHWGIKVGGGCVVFELCGVTKNTAISAFKTGGAKLPIKTIIFD